MKILTNEPSFPGNPSQPGNPDGPAGPGLPAGPGSPGSPCNKYSTIRPMDLLKRRQMEQIYGNNF